MPGQMLYDLRGHEGFAMNANGNLFRLSENGKWYRIKLVEEPNYEFMKDAMEDMWEQLGLDRKFPTKKHEIVRKSLKQVQFSTQGQEQEQDQDSRQRLFAARPRPRTGRPKDLTADLEDIQKHFDAVQISKPRPKKSLAQREMSEYEPTSTWLNHLSKHKHRVEPAKVERALDALDDNDNDNGNDNSVPTAQYACPCRVGCLAPRTPLGLIDPNLSSRLKAKKQAFLADPAPFDSGTATKAQAALKKLLSCQKWRTWIRSANGEDENDSASNLGLTLDDLHAATNFAGSRTVDLVDNHGGIFGAAHFDVGEKITVVVDPNFAKEAKHAFSSAGFSQASVRKVKDGKMNTLQLLLKTNLVGLVFPAKAQDLLKLQPLVEAVSDMAGLDMQAVCAQLKYVL